MTATPAPPRPETRPEPRTPRGGDRESGRAWRRDPVLSQVFQRLDPAVADSFDAAQRQALRQLLSPRLRGQRRGLGLVWPWFGRRYFLALTFGRDRRRRSAAGRTAPCGPALLGTAACALLVFAGLTLALAMA